MAVIPRNSNSNSNSNIIIGFTTMQRWFLPVLIGLGIGLVLNWNVRGCNLMTVPPPIQTHLKYDVDSDDGTAKNDHLVLPRVTTNSELKLEEWLDSEEGGKHPCDGVYLTAQREGDEARYHHTPGYDFRSKSGLFCIIAGIEHTGTTMTSSLIMSAPNLYGGFELGLLRSERGPLGFATNVTTPMWLKGITAPPSNHFWGLSEEHKQEMLQAECYAEAYQTIRRRSPIYQQSPLNTKSWLVDKTPGYYRNLLSVMERTPGVPVIVTQKEDQAVIDGYRKRNVGMVDINNRLRAFHTQLQLCLEAYPDRVFVLNYTEFSQHPNRVMSQVYNFLNIQSPGWDESYLTLEAFNAKGRPLDRPAAPSFNATRSNCKDCDPTSPYGKKTN